MVKNLLVIITLFLIGPKAQATINQFETDWCTYFPEGTLAKPSLWADCCLYHDLKYWIGGTIQEQMASDLKLKSCVATKANSFYANMMYQGVRFGHLSPIKSKYRWGWGIDKNGHFNALTSEQKLIARKLIENSTIDVVIKELFIQEYLD